MYHFLSFSGIQGPLIYRHLPGPLIYRHLPDSPQEDLGSQFKQKMYESPGKQEATKRLDGLIIRIPTSLTTSYARALVEAIGTDEESNGEVDSEFFFSSLKHLAFSKHVCMWMIRRQAIVIDHL